MKTLLMLSVFCPAGIGSHPSNLASSFRSEHTRSSWSTLFSTAAPEYRRVRRLSLFHKKIVVHQQISLSKSISYLEWSSIGIHDRSSIHVPNLEQRDEHHEHEGEIMLRCQKITNYFSGRFVEPVCVEGL